MVMMKNPVLLVACTLLLFSLVLASQTSFSPDKCCFRFFSNKLPKRNAVNYKYTDSRCPMAGVLFTMKRGSEICADPNTEWVQNIISAIDRVKAKAVTSAAPQQSE